MDWWPITRSKDLVSVEWSPQGGTVRAKLRGSGDWRYSDRSVDAKYAEMVGEGLAREITKALEKRRK